VYNYSIVQRPINIVDMLDNSKDNSSKIENELNETGHLSSENQSINEEIESTSDDLRLF
jgi:hypothetical protein